MELDLGLDVDLNLDMDMDLLDLDVDLDLLDLDVDLDTDLDTDLNLDLDMDKVKKYISREADIFCIGETGTAGEFFNDSINGHETRWCKWEDVESKLHEAFDAGIDLGIELENELQFRRDTGQKFVPWNTDVLFKKFMEGQDGSN